MRSISLFLPILAARAFAQVTVTEYVTLPSSTLTSASFHKQAVESASPASSTFATSASITAILAASAATTTQASDYNSDSDNGNGNQVDTDAGASGSDGGSFSISKGGIIAIAVVVSIVAVFGIASTILFVVAKRRQWNIRASIARAGRKVMTPLTPRFPKDARSPPPSSSANRRQTTMHAGRLATPKDAGHKRGLVVDEREKRADLEKGVAPLKGKAPENKRGGGGWMQRLWDNDWK